MGNAILKVYCCFMYLYIESLKRRVSLLKNTPSSVLLKVRDRIQFSPGARELTRILRCLGVRMAVVSGGFLPLAQFVKNELNLDYAFANEVRSQFYQ